MFGTPWHAREEGSHIPQKHSQVLQRIPKDLQLPTRLSDPTHAIPRPASSKLQCCSPSEASGCCVFLLEVRGRFQWGHPSRGVFIIFISVGSTSVVALLNPSLSRLSAHHLSNSIRCVPFSNPSHRQFLWYMYIIFVPRSFNIIQPISNLCSTHFKDPSFKKKKKLVEAMVQAMANRGSPLRRGRHRPLRPLRPLRPRRLGRQKVTNKSWNNDYGIISIFYIYI